MKKDKRKKSSRGFLAGVRSLPGPVREVILWVMMAFIVGLAVFFMGRRLKQSTRRVGEIRKNEVFGEPDRLEEINEKKEAMEKQWKQLEKAGKLLKDLNEERFRQEEIEKFSK